jgi:hypothetical protein
MARAEARRHGESMGSVEHEMTNKKSGPWGMKKPSLIDVDL